MPPRYPAPAWLTLKAIRSVELPLGSVARKTAVEFPSRCKRFRVTHWPTDERRWNCATRVANERAATTLVENRFPIRAWKVTSGLTPIVSEGLVAPLHRTAYTVWMVGLAK